MMGDRLRVCFAVPPVTASSAPESAEGLDDDVASVVSIPRLWIKLWLIWPLLSMTLLPSLVCCQLLHSLRGTILNLCSRCRLRLSQIVRLSASLLRLLRLRVLVHQAWRGGGGGGGVALRLGHPPVSLLSTVFTVRRVQAFSFDHIEFCSVYCASSSVSLLFRCNGLEDCGSPSLALRLRQQ